jgi:hypothetical protein
MPPAYLKGPAIVKPARVTDGPKCAAKRIFDTKREAKSAIVKTAGKKLYPYHCRCGWWHLTSQAPGVAKSRSAE